MQTRCPYLFDEKGEIDCLTPYREDLTTAFAEEYCKTCKFERCSAYKEQEAMILRIEQNKSIVDNPYDNEFGLEAMPDHSQHAQSQASETKSIADLARELQIRIRKENPGLIDKTLRGEAPEEYM